MLGRQLMRIYNALSDTLTILLIQQPQEATKLLAKPDDHESKDYFLEFCLIYVITSDREYVHSNKKAV